MADDGQDLPSDGILDQVTDDGGQLVSAVEEAFIFTVPELAGAKRVWISSWTLTSSCANSHP